MTTQELATTTAIEAAGYEAVIGLEVHAQLLTRSKMFCSCSADYWDAEPNSNTCPVCLGLPGTLPVINRVAIEDTVLTALALDCEIPPFTKFDRKNYFYPDLPKGYQISQYDLPLSRNGVLRFTVGDREVRCGITRVHLEEDTGTLKHAGDLIHQATSSLVDLNRAGVPLMEIVGEPDLRSPEEAREYMVRLRQVLMYIGVNGGSMERGQLRCDANVSLRRSGEEQFGVKVEIKNMNSFRAVFRALEYEIERQLEVLQGGGTLVQETRGWIETEGRTVSQRSKEQAHDYRYFPEPDLPPLQLDREFVERVRLRLPELPDARQRRFQAEYGLSAYDAGILCAVREEADAFESVVRAGVPAKLAANWQIGDVARLANAHHVPLQRSGLGTAGLAALLSLLDAGTVNGATAKALLDELYLPGGDPRAIVQERGLGQVSDASALGAIVDEVIAANPKPVADFRGGREQALQSLVGQVMKETRGRADAKLATALLRERLGG
jgi:aspartyl-tRNA(Asn)/glutamyl-tRNA(Gln) amidotransferase subunit B